MGEVLRLRVGKAPERIARLFTLAQAAGAEPLRLRLRDIAAITGLRIETVSRTLKAMEAGGLS
jgi:DNA-binding MarR family transcriptional regulator